MSAGGWDGRGFSEMKVIEDFNEEGALDTCWHPQIFNQSSIPPGVDLAVLSI